MATLVSQSEFARLEGKSRSYITALKQAGRLVMQGDQVDVEASRARIAQTADPNRDDVARRHASNKNEAPSESTLQADKIGSSYQAARAVKEKYAAMTAKIEYERASGQLIDRAMVEAAVADLVTSLRQGLEQQPNRIAAQLIGLELDALRATLKEEHQALLKNFIAEWSKILAELTGQAA